MDDELYRMKIVLPGRHERTHEEQGIPLESETQDIPSELETRDIFSILGAQSKFAPRSPTFDPSDNAKGLPPKGRN